MLGRQLLHTSARQPTTIQEIFIGMAFDITSDKTELCNTRRAVNYTMVLHDGTGVTESETFLHPFDVKAGDELEKQREAKGLLNSVMERLTSLQRDKMMDPIPVELSSVQGVEFAATVWLHLDAIPFIISPATSIFTRLPALSTATGATSAVQSALQYLHPITHSATTADIDPKDHRVPVDSDNRVQLCSLMQYKQTSSPELWTRFIALTNHLKSHHTTIAFFSATPQGGGVALMRHALIRLWRLVGIDVQWYTPEGHPAIFDITKRKIHNVLQGVSEVGEEMGDEDKEWFEAWTEQNYEQFWKNGAIDADVIIIDDPQLTALIPIIKKHRPRAKIVFRSHIQIQAALTDNPTTPQYRTWNYLFNFIKHVDLFLAHPVEEFVPKCVKDNLPVLYMAPSTHPLDGLNKPYGTASTDYYRQIFNHLAREQGGTEIDWDRPYICQIGRFDPSKGIDILLEAYLQFRNRLDRDDSSECNEGIPQLIIMGHGSVDDPDGTRIYEEVHQLKYQSIDSKRHKHIQGDIAAVRAPPSDSLLGCILQGSWLATQLSTREGFEIKVTEAIHKSIPIIASDAGGIPLQIKHGENGWLVPSGDSKAVSSILYDFYTTKIKLNRPDQTSGPNERGEEFVKDLEKDLRPMNDLAQGGGTSEDFWTVGNACKWMLLVSRLLGLGVDLGREGDREVLENMGVGMGLNGEIGGNVWGLVMGEDIDGGEGYVRELQ